jgi:hypothetical protein
MKSAIVDLVECCADRIAGRVAGASITLLQGWSIAAGIRELLSKRRVWLW